MFYMRYKWGIAQQHVVTLRHCAAILSDTDCGSCDRAHDVKRWKNRKRRIITAPESIRAFVLNHMSVFLPSPCTSNGTINDLLFLFASSTGEMEMESGAGANIEVGRFFKNPCFWGHQRVCFSHHWRVLYISPWFWHRHRWLWYKREEDGLGW